MAKRKITDDRAWERAECDLDNLADAMADCHVATTYDLLLEIAARLRERLSEDYRPSSLPDDRADIARFPRLVIDTVPVDSRLYHSLICAPQYADRKLLAAWRTDGMDWATIREQIKAGTTAEA